MLRKRMLIYNMIVWATSISSLGKVCKHEKETAKRVVVVYGRRDQVRVNFEAYAGRLVRYVRRDKDENGGGFFRCLCRCVSSK